MNLSVSTLFFELALIFIPGFIWMKIHSRYGFIVASQTVLIMLRPPVAKVTSASIRAVKGQVGI